MTRRHKTLENMLEVARNNGESIREKWAVFMERENIYTWENGYKQATFTDVGFKQIENVKDTYTIKHHGTTILQIEETGNLYTGYNRKVTHIYGISKSDADAINAILDYMGITGTRYTYKPVNGGFQSVEV